MLFQCCRLWAALISKRSAPLHQAPSCPTHTSALLLLQPPNTSHATEGLQPRARCRAALFRPGPTSLVSPHHSQAPFTMGLSHVSSQRSRQGQDIGSGSPLNGCIGSTYTRHSWKLALAKPNRSSAPPATGCTTLLFLVEITDAPSPISAALPKLGESWNTENPPLETGFTLSLCLPFQHFRQRRHFCFQSCLSKGLKYFCR